MQSFTLVISIVFAFIFALPSFAADPVDINWEDLLPEQRPYHDPFLELDYNQINDLAKLYRIEKMKSGEDDDTKRQEALEIRERLKSEGLDPDWLFGQREIVMNQRRLAATEPNNDLLGQSVRLPGYLLPLEMEGEKAVEFLLVPTVGACIHTPPPPANQMVFVRYPQGFVVEGLYSPVWISGEMTAQNRTQALSYVDGQANVETSYVVNAMLVENYE